MDDQRFDNFTRALAGATTRRRALKLLGGLTAGLGAASLAARTAQAGCFSEGGGCATDTDCCQGLICSNLTCSTTEICSGEGDPCPIDFSAGVRATIVPDCCEGLVCNGLSGVCEAICTPAGELCKESSECCDGLVCESGLCLDPSSICREVGESCLPLTRGEASTECCIGLVCDEETLTCEEPVTCVEDGLACENDEECCEGICCAGFCRNIECCIDEEDPNARCPEGTSCFEGICDEVACGGEGDPCADNAECCGTLICWEGACAVPVDDDKDPEPVTSLPNTGSGANDGNSGLIAGAALAAGAAALIGSRHLRTPRATEQSS